MIDLSRYMKDGRVEREAIAMDIKNGEISESDLNSIINHPSIKKAFIGEEYKDKKASSIWSKGYLDELSYAVVSESFNADYLRYLYDVAKYVNGGEKKRSKFLFIVVALIIIAIIIGFIVTTNSSNKDEQQSSIATTVMVMKVEVVL